MADSFSYEQLIASGEGKLFSADSGRLPLPPMLMFDRITHIDTDGGAHGLGKIVAELDIKRVIKRKLNMAIGDARLLADGKEIYVANDLRVGLFLREGEGQGTAA